MNDSPAVKLWRDTFRLNISASWKADVDKTVTDIELWREILSNWYYFDAKGKKHTKHPGIKNLLNEYERLAATNEDAEKRNGQKPVSDSDRPWLSEGSGGEVREVRSSAERLYFGVDRLV